MIATGLALIAVSLITLGICLPGKQGTKKWFLRGGADVLAAILIVTCLGLGIVALVVGAAQS
jgi:hypothetical protein